MRGEVMPSLIRPGGDLVETTNAQLGIRLGDLEDTRLILRVGAFGWRYGFLYSSLCCLVCAWPI